MRLTSEFWVGAFVRRCMSGDAYAVVRKKGAAEAGAIWIVVDDLKGHFTLYAPAPMMFLDEQEDNTADGRKFIIALAGAGSEDISGRLGREQKFDSDLWIIEVETKDGIDFIPLAKGHKKASEPALKGSEARAAYGDKHSSIRGIN